MTDYIRPYRLRNGISRSSPSLILATPIHEIAEAEEIDPVGDDYSDAGVFVAADNRWLGHVCNEST